MFSVSKTSNDGDRLKRVFPKFRGDRGLVRGVNDRSKFEAERAFEVREGGTEVREGIELRESRSAEGLTVI